MSLMEADLLAEAKLSRMLIMNEAVPAKHQEAPKPYTTVHNNAVARDMVDISLIYIDIHTFWLSIYAYSAGT